MRFDPRAAPKELPDRSARPDQTPGAYLVAAECRTFPDLETDFRHDSPTRARRRPYRPAISSRNQSLGLLARNAESPYRVDSCSAGFLQLPRGQDQDLLRIDFAARCARAVTGRRCQSD